MIADSTGRCKHVPLEEASHLLQASARWEGGQHGGVLPSLDRALTSRIKVLHDTAL